jgi:hypothetical protein
MRASRGNASFSAERMAVIDPASVTVRPTTLGPLLFALLIAAEPSLAAPKPKIVGQMSGLPSRTPAVVAAVDPNTLAVLAAARVKATGRYKLPVKARLTMLFGNAESDVWLAGASRAFRPGPRRTRMDVTLEPALAPAAASRVPSAGDATPTAAVTVDWEMTGSIGGRQRRIGHLVEADLVRAAASRCHLTTITSAPERRQAVEDEVARQAAGADPSTAITFDPTPPTIRVRGDGMDSSGGQTVTLQAVEIGTENVIAEASDTGVNAFTTIERAAREMALRLCDLVGTPLGAGDPYLVVVAGTHSAQFAYRTPEVRDPMCDSHDEADGSQMFSFESDPVPATVARRNGITVVTLAPVPVTFTGARTASYRFFRDGACFPPTPVDTSGCGAPQDPLGLASFEFTQSKIRTTLAFPNYVGCPFTPLIDANRAVGEAALDPKRLASGRAAVFTFQRRQDEDEGDEAQGLVNRAGAVTSWTVTFTPAD